MPPREFHEPEWLFPFDGMEVGDSFFIPTLDSEKMVSIITKRAKAAGIKVSVMPFLNKGTLGVRAWRLE
jgi:hypothetical protein